MAFEEKVLNINGVKYQYFDTGGSGPILVVLHGLVGSKEAILDFVEPLTDSFRCVIPDLPGHGGLPFSGDVGLPWFVDYVLSLLDHLRIVKFGLVGFSFGGFVALEIVKSKEVEGSSIPTVLWSVPFDFGVTKFGYLCLQASRFLPSKLWMFALDVGEKLGLINISSGAVSAVGKFDGGIVPFACSALKEYMCPVTSAPLLYVYGAKDILITEGCFEDIDVSGSKSSSKVLIEEGGHLATEVGRDKALKEIVVFFKKNP